MSRHDEPPDWALPAWDSLPGTRLSKDPVPNAQRPGAGSGATSDLTPATGGRTAAPPSSLRILAVSDVTRAVKDALRGDPRLAEIWVEGEVGRVTISSAGHGYFTLKDERSQLSCIWFRDDRLASPFEPQAGLRVVAHGRIDVYDPGGVYQLYVSALQPAGFGDLALRFEALKARLAAEGLFESGRKRPLPPRPAVIAVVTSPTGAVWHDVRNVLARRWPLSRVVLSPCVVQGDGAPVSVVRALARVDRWAERCRAEGRPDDAPAVTILARGGGSLEDLWAFNDEAVVRAVVGHRRPVVCGVGHETDVTLADFAADVRAPTPSAAAELVVPDRVELAAWLVASVRRFNVRAEDRLSGARRELMAERRALDRLQPAAQLAQARERVGGLLDRATAALEVRIADGRRSEERLLGRLEPLLPARLRRDRERLDRAAGLLPILSARRVATARAGLAASAAALGALGPQATLDRGYAIVRRASDERIVRDPIEAPAGSRLRVRVARGDLDATVDGRPREPDA
jgi:exodeoxyribonuclease VII large subunit